MRIIATTQKDNNKKWMNNNDIECKLMSILLFALSLTYSHMFVNATVAITLTKRCYEQRASMTLATDNFCSTEWIDCQSENSYHIYRRIHFGYTFIFLPEIYLSHQHKKKKQIYFSPRSIFFFFVRKRMAKSITIFGLHTRIFSTVHQIRVYFIRIPNVVNV